MGEGSLKVLLVKELLVFFSNYLPVCIFAQVIENAPGLGGPLAQESAKSPCSREICALVVETGAEILALAAAPPSGPPSRGAPAMVLI
jgi:hypothetical protein